MADILFSKPIEFADVYALNELFRTEAGRRQFTQIMHRTMKEVCTTRDILQLRVAQNQGSLFIGSIIGIV